MMRSTWLSEAAQNDGVSRATRTCVRAYVSIYMSIYISSSPGLHVRGQVYSFAVVKVVSLTVYITETL